MERAQPNLAVRQPLLHGMDDPVRSVVALRGARVDVAPRPLVRMEARDVGRVEVSLRRALDRPLGDSLRDPGRLLDPDRRDRPQVLHLRLAEKRHPVWRERQQTVDRMADACAFHGQDLGHQLERLLELRVEVLRRERQLGRRERGLLARRDVVGVHEDRPVRVRADLHVAPVLALVHVRVHVADDREGDLARGLLEERDRADGDHLVRRGRQRDRRPGHARDPRAPDAARDEDVLAVDRALVGVHTACSASLDVDARHLGAGEHACAASLGVLAHERAGSQRVDDVDARRVEGPEDHARVDEGDPLDRLLGREELASLLAPRERRRDAPVQLLHPLRRPRELDPAAPRRQLQLHVLSGALLRERRHLLRVVDGEDEVRRVARGAAGIRESSFLDQDEVGPAEPGQVVREAVADDARPDDDRLRGGGAHAPVKTRRMASPKSTTCRRIVSSARSASPSRIASSSSRWPSTACSSSRVRSSARYQMRSART